MVVVADITDPPLLHLCPGATREEAIAGLEQAARGAGPLRGVECCFLGCRVDAELADQLLGFCAALPAGGAVLRLAHSDLGSGTDCEQRLFERLAEREAREAEKKYHEQAKRDSSKEKDFAVSAGKRRRAEEGIVVATERLARLDGELAELNCRKAEAPWHALFTQMEARGLNAVACLDLSDCGLHATALVLLTHVLLELDHRAAGEQVSAVALDGNDLGDMGMGAIASFLRLSSGLQALSLRNVGITERGMSQVLSGLVGNKTLALLDVRSNGLSSVEVGKAAIEGVRRFNSSVEILIE